MTVYTKSKTRAQYQITYVSDVLSYRIGDVFIGLHVASRIGDSFVFTPGHCVDY